MLFVNRTGFGLSVMLNPALKASMTAVTAYTPGGVKPLVAIDPGAAPGYSINQHSFYQIFTEMYPGSPWMSEKGVTPRTATGGWSEDYKAKWIEARRARLRAAAEAAQLPLCSSEYSGNTCHYQNNAAFIEHVDGAISIVPPGLIHNNGVVFSVQDFSDKRFLKRFRPDPTQRKELELAVIHKSIYRLLGNTHPEGALSPYGGKISSDGNPSVGQVMARVPDIALYWVNFDRNPLQPTPSEHTQPGGWAAWIRKGGYPLSRALLQGQEALYESGGLLETCTDLPCRCATRTTKTNTGQDLILNGVPVCKSEKLEGTYKSYVIVNPSVVDPWFEYSLVQQDPSLFTRITSWISDKTTLACQYAPQSNPYVAAVCTAHGLRLGLTPMKIAPNALPPADPSAIPAQGLPLDVFATLWTPLKPATSTAPGTAPQTQRYKGCVARYNTTRKVFAIYCPPPSSLGFPGDLFGDLGADAVTPAVPMTSTGTSFVKVAESPVLPQQGETQVGSEKDKFFRLNNPFMWIAFVGGAAAIGTGGYLIYRRRRAA